VTNLLREITGYVFNFRKVGMEKEKKAASSGSDFAS